MALLTAGLLPCLRKPTLSLHQSSSSCSNTRICTSRFTFLAFPSSLFSPSGISSFASHPSVSQVSSRPRLAFVNASVSVVTEPATSLQFPEVTIPTGGSQELLLLGAGVREKAVAVLKVKVYAVALYFDAAAVASALGVFAGQPLEVLEKDSLLLTSIAQAPVEKAVVIVLARNVDGKTFVSALEEELQPRLTAAGLAEEERKKLLEEFGANFQNRPLKKLTRISLTWVQPTTLKVSISDVGGGSETTAMDSLPLLTSLFDIYLGSSAPVSPSLIKSITAKVASL
eukprot:TRINITY_DN184_c1_g1_i2.p1 TRINITY_DN184_c1_g1~~TRINITY_DN184_c1_g1_i2.p1  ORF type:complete len:285 (+),score=87.01 TRINITY_DN184_c1_g1_i2:166-1020(+)